MEKEEANIKLNVIKLLFFIISIFLFFYTYFILSIKDIYLPGLNFDEVASASSAMNLLLNKNSFHSAVEIFSFGRQFPVMFHNYLPSLEAYILIPFFVFLGINVFALRVASVFFGLLTLVFIYLFAKEFFNKKVALFTLILLATSPYFIFLTRLGNYFHSYSLFFSICALFCFLKWYRSRNMTYYLCGAFLLGLGFSTVLWIIIFIIGLLVLAFIFRKDIKEKMRENKFKFYCILGIISFCLGDFLFLYANFINKPSRFMTFKYIFNHIYTKLDINNMDYINNLGTRFKNFLEILQEKALITIFSHHRECNIFYPIIFFSILIWLIFSLFFRKKMYFRKEKITFLLVLIAIVFFASPFTVSSFQSHHLFILAPFIKMIIVVGVIEFVAFFKNQKLQKISWLVLTGIFIVLTGINLKILEDYYADLKSVGGEGVWSDAIYELSAWIKEVKPPEIVALNVGLFRNLYFLMQGEKSIYNVYDFWHNDDPFNVDKIIQEFGNFFEYRDAAYLLNIQGHEGRERIELFMNSFRQAVEIKKRQLIEEKVFYQRDNKPVYIVYSVR